MLAITYDIEGGDQIYINPESRILYSWYREHGEPAASHEGRDRWILAVHEEVDPSSLEQWLSARKRELEDIIALWSDESGWRNYCDETAIAIHRLQTAYDEAVADGVLAFFEQR